ncbi:MAG: PaaI family thioesterase, partial [Acidobacteriota bacterium]|nr:PaaI family thioesterase [Acidobacteriota bacterium]
MIHDAFQDNYPDELAHCYGCGRLNEHGHQIKSHWDGEETVAVFIPEPYHIAIPGYVYGGLIASLVD